MQAELKTIKKSLKEDFYGRLTRGQIDKVKRTSVFLFQYLDYFSDEISTYIQGMKDAYPEEIEVIEATWKVFEKLIKSWKGYVQLEVLPLTEEDFETLSPEEQAEYITMFREMFVKKTQLMLQCVRTLIKQFDIIDKKSSRVRLPIVRYDPKYVALKEENKVYAPQQEIIDRVEMKIRQFLALGLTNSKKVTDPILTGPWAGYLHAWLPRPLNDHRIVYTWNPKTRIVNFLLIDTHKKVGID